MSAFIRKQWRSLWTLDTLVFCLTCSAIRYTLRHGLGLTGAWLMIAGPLGIAVDAMRRTWWGRLNVRDFGAHGMTLEPNVAKPAPDPWLMGFAIFFFFGIVVGSLEFFGS